MNRQPYDDEECSCYDYCLCPVCEAEIERLELKDNEFLSTAVPEGDGE